jgi:hypothetical protein
MTTPTPGYEELFAENQRLKAVQPVGSKTTLYVMSIVVLCILAAAFVVVITIVRPGADNATLIASVVGLVVPVNVALLAATVQQVHVAVNSRLSQLLELTAAASLAEGKIAGKADAVTAPPTEG